MTNLIDIMQYNLEIEEAMQRMDAGEFYTHEEVVEMSKGWLSSRSLEASDENNIL
jgi:predicted transcriptional regulator